MVNREPGRQHRRADQIAEHNRDLAALALDDGEWATTSLGAGGAAVVSIATVGAVSFELPVTAKIRQHCGRNAPCRLPVQRKRTL
jgi:hypothetical protein